MTARALLPCLLLAAVAGCDDAKNPAGPTTASAAAPTPATHEVKGAAPVAPQLCEHGVPADLCTKCTPELAEVFKEQGDWCNEHGLPESHCKQCNPGLDFTAAASPSPAEGWCREHAIEEAKCTKCNPQLIAKYIEAGDYCREHGFPESACPYCNPELPKAVGLPPPTFPAPGTVVRLASPELEAKAGIETVRAELRAFAESLEVVGRLDFNQNKLAQLSARGEALIQEVKVDVGDAVKAGQPLVVLASAGVGEVQGQLTATKAKLEAARAAFAREQSLVERGISPKKELEQAQAALAEAEGEHQAALSSLKAAGASAASVGGRYVLAAPFGGVVVTRDAVAGRTVASGQTLIEVADLSTMWALLDVPEESASKVRPGQKVIFQLEGSGAEPIEASVSRVAASVDAKTRTVRVRMDIPNPDGRLKAGAFLRAKIQTGGEQGALLLPRDALQEAEGQQLVFVRTGPGVYEPVNVEVGTQAGDAVAVLRGLRPGSEVVTTGAFMLKTEILKDSIGAGCVDD